MTRTLFRALAALLLLAGIARADGEPPAGKDRIDADQRAANEAQRTKFRVQVRTQIEQALAAAAGLDPATSARVAAVIDRIDDHVAQLQRDNHAAYLELKALLEQPQPDPNAVNRLIDRITANRAGVLHAEEDRTREVRRLLTPVQYGKIVIAYPMVNRQIRAHIRRALTDQANAIDDALNE